MPDKTFLPFGPTDFATPFVDLKTGLLTDYWQRKFSHLFQGPNWKGGVIYPDVNPLGPGGGEQAEAAMNLAQILAANPVLFRDVLEYMTASTPLNQVPPPIDSNEIEARIPPNRDFSTFRFIYGTAANLVNYPPSLYTDAYYIETDTFKTWFSIGSAWSPIYAPALLVMFAASTTQGALKSGTDGGGLGILMARLGDDSAYADMWVLDEAYGGSWNGSIAVPTKNAVYDKIESVLAVVNAIVSDAVYGVGWDGDTTHAPSKNAVYDKIETLLSKNGVNFGPAAVASITVVDGQITAIS